MPAAAAQKVPASGSGPVLEKERHGTEIHGERDQTVAPDLSDLERQALAPGADQEGDGGGTKHVS